MESFTISLPCYPCDKELFPGAQLSPDDERESTTFYNDFKIAEMYGIENFNAVKDTFNRAFRSWKNSIKYVTELAVVLNNLGWEHYNHHGDISAFYFDCYNKICDHVYQADDNGKNIGPFNDDEVLFFHNVLD